MDIIKEAKQYLRLLDNYYINEDIKKERIVGFFQEVIKYEFQHIKILDASLQSIFDKLCQDIIRIATIFINSKEKDLNEARNLLMLIVSVENYLSDIEKLPWQIGRKISFFEKLKIRSIFRKKLHDGYDEKTKRSVRGTRVFVKLTGSLAKGYSDWKLINGGKIPKPTDYNIPREYRKSKSIYSKLDEDLNIPQKLKPLMSDVDILVINEVIFDSLNMIFAHKDWSFRLGEKYMQGVGDSPILGKIHQALLGIKIGGIRNRWINYIILRDEEGYAKYTASRNEAVQALENKIGKKVAVEDVLILDETIH